MVEYSMTNILLTTLKVVSELKLLVKRGGSERNVKFDDNFYSKDVL